MSTNVGVFGRLAAPRAAWVAVTATAVLTLAGCSTSERSVGVDASEVERIELYTFDVDSQPDEVDLTTVTDPASIEEVVAAYTKVPVSTYDGTVEELAGGRATAVRFLLDDGTDVDLTAVFMGPLDVVIFWDDGSADVTEWGVAWADYASEMGVTTSVPASSVPASPVSDSLG